MLSIDGIIGYNGLVNKIKILKNEIM